MDFYKDTNNNVWYEVDEEKNFRCINFGFYVVELLNLCSYWSSKEHFINCLTTLLDPNSQICKEYRFSDEKGSFIIENLSNVYDDGLKDVLGWYKEYSELLVFIQRVPDYKKEKNYDMLAGMYLHFKFFLSMISRGQYEPISNERFLKWENKEKDFIEFCGHTFFHDAKIPCEHYKTKNHSDIFILDLWEFLFNSQIPKINVCKECGLLFVSNNTNATYCNICKKAMNQIRYRNRKENKERFLHKQIIDFLYSIDETKSLSNEFLNESNYYWDIVCGKEVETNNMYNEKITSNEQYYEWLLKKRSQYKKRGKNNGS